MEALHLLEFWKIAHHHAGYFRNLENCLWQKGTGVWFMPKL
jgi:hypothetical protein